MPQYKNPFSLLLAAWSLPSPWYVSELFLFLSSRIILYSAFLIAGVKQRSAMTSKCQHPLSLSVSLLFSALRWLPCPPMPSHKPLLFLFLKKELNGPLISKGKPNSYLSKMKHALITSHQAWRCMATAKVAKVHFVDAQVMLYIQCPLTDIISIRLDWHSPSWLEIWMIFV